MKEIAYKASTKRRRSAFALALMVAIGLESSAQTQTQAVMPKSKNQIRVVANEVTVPVTVTDKSGEVVLDLQQNDFHVLDDGAVQTIDHWELGGDPLAVALVVETSSRLHAVIPANRNISSVFT